MNYNALRNLVGTMQKARDRRRKFGRLAIPRRLLPAMIEPQLEHEIFCNSCGAPNYVKLIRTDDPRGLRYVRVSLQGPIDCRCGNHMSLGLSSTGDGRVFITIFSACKLLSRK